MLYPLTAEHLTALTALISAATAFLRVLAGLVAAFAIRTDRRFSLRRAGLAPHVLTDQLTAGMNKGHPKDTHPVTPDGRYFVVHGRLWRRSDPDLPETSRQALVNQVMAARRAVRTANGVGDEAAAAAAHAAVDQAKRQLGERGPVWWSDGAPDLNRRMAANTPYADWFAALSAAATAHL